MVTHDVELARRMPRLIEVHDGVLYEQNGHAPAALEAATAA
jgi:hypothetical protein